MTDTSREALIAMMRDYAYEGDTWVLQQEAADMLEADGKPKNFLRLRGQLEQEWADVRALKEASKSKAQQVAVPALTPLTPEQTHEALTAASVDTFYMTHAVTRKELWFTQGSTDVMSIVRAIERAHGIGEKP